MNSKSIKCGIIDKGIEKLAEGLNISAQDTLDYVNAWKNDVPTGNPPKTRKPSLKNLKAYIDRQKTIKELQEALLVDKDSEKDNYKEHKEGIVKVDMNNPIAALNRDISIENQTALSTKIRRSFSNKIDILLENKITELQDELLQAENDNNTKEAERIKGLLYLYKNPEKSRAIIIQEVGAITIINEIFKDLKDLSTKNIEYFSKIKSIRNPENMEDIYKKAVKHFGALLNDAIPYIEYAENLKIETLNTDYSGEYKIYDPTNEEYLNYENENGKSTKGNEGWSYKIRTVAPYDTLSYKVKRTLYNITLLSPEGTLVYDSLGNTRYMSAELAHGILLHNLSKMTDVSDFYNKEEDTFPALEALVQRYPWVEQIIDLLYEDPSLQAAYFSNYNKYYINYYKTEGGKHIQLNAPLGVQTIIETLQNNIEQGITLTKDSIYTSYSEIREKQLSEMLKLADKLDKTQIEDINPEDLVSFLRNLGIDTDINSVNYFLENDPEAITKIITNSYSILNTLERSLKHKKEIHLYKDNSNFYINIAEELGAVSEGHNMQTFRHLGEMYPSYVAPNMIETMFKNFKNSNKVAKYLQENYKNVKWFFSNGKWNNEWLRLIETDKKVRESIEMKDVLSIEGRQYTEWEDIPVLFIREFLATGNDTQAWYHTPIIEATTVAKFIKFKKYSGETMIEDLTPLIRNVIKQEIVRIIDTKKRNALGIYPINSFDKRGQSFLFFPELEYSKEEILTRAQEAADSLDVEKFNNYLDDVIIKMMDAKVTKFYNTLTDVSLNAITAAGQNKKTTNEIIEEYVWNNTFAQSQIIQITATDLAFFKDETDFQKRYKQVYASGNKLYPFSKYGRETEKILVIEDDVVAASHMSAIKGVLQTMLDNKVLNETEYDNILNNFNNIESTDGQAFRSISSYRAVLDMMGAWTDEMQETFDRFQNGTWEMQDFQTVWQTIKPYLYTFRHTPNGINPGETIKVPYQNKNSEFLLLSTFSMLSSINNNAPMLTGINQFMEDKGIDVVQFKSAVKVGNQGSIQLSANPAKMQSVINHFLENGLTTIMEGYNGTYSDFKKKIDLLRDTQTITAKEYKEIFESIKYTSKETYEALAELTSKNFLIEQYKSKLESGEITEDTYNDLIHNLTGDFNNLVVHEVPYSDYMVQQPNPEHLIDSNSVYGSQYRNIIVSNLPEGFTIKLGNHEFSKQEIIEIYDTLIIDNLLEGYDSITDIFSSKENLNKFLLDSIKGNPKYGKDMIDALTMIDVKTESGETVKDTMLPIESLNINNKIQELVNSIFKNRVTKQKINGGSAVLTTDYGLKERLQVVRKEDGSIDYAEVYMPAWSKKFLKPLLESDGSLNINKKNADGSPILSEELLEMIGFRIPTEDKYSMMVFKVKGFLPQQNGGSVVIPSELLTLSGCDFDIDKLFLFIYNTKIYLNLNREESIKAIRDNFRSEVKHLDNTELQNILNDIEFNDITFEEGTLEYTIQEFVKDNKDLHTKISIKKDSMFKKTATKEDIMNIIKQGGVDKAKRDNLLIDIGKNILRSAEMKEFMTSPGSFNSLSRESNITKIITNSEILKIFKNKYNITTPEQIRSKLKSMSNKELKDFTSHYSENRDPLSTSTFAYYHSQNMAGLDLIGIFASANTIFTKLQEKGLKMKSPFSFHLDGIKYESLDSIKDKNGTYITKNISEFLAASVDNAKDPVLATLLQNPNTANITIFMLYSGMSIENIALLFNQPLMRKVLNMGKKISTNIFFQIKEIKEIIKARDEKVDHSSYGINTTTTKELFDNIIETKKDLSNFDLETMPINLLKRNLKGLFLMQRIVDNSEDLNIVLGIMKHDSPTNAIDISYAGALVQKQKIDNAHNKIYDPEFAIEGYNSIMINGAPLGGGRDSKIDFFNSTGNPRLQAAYSLGIELPLSLISEFMIQGHPTFVRNIEHLRINSGKGLLSDFLINNYYTKAINYLLSDTKLFGNDGDLTFLQKRDYYINDFPQEFLKRKKDKKNKFLQNSIMDSIIFHRGDLVFRNSGKSTPTMKNYIMKGFDSLLFDENPLAIETAYDLFMYGYYKEGLMFGPNNINNFFSPTFLNSFPEYINTLRNLKEILNTENILSKFNDQFYRYNSKIFPNLNVEEYNTITGEAMVNINKAYNKNIMGLEQPEVYPYMQIQDMLYVLSAAPLGSSIVTYSPLPMSYLGVYSAQDTIEDIIEHYREKEEKDKKEQEAAYTSYMASFTPINSEMPTTTNYEYNTSENDPSLDIDALRDFYSTEIFDSLSEEDIPPLSMGETKVGEDALSLYNRIIESKIILADLPVGDNLDISEYQNEEIEEDTSSLNDAIKNAGYSIDDFFEVDNPNISEYQKEEIKKVNEEVNLCSKND